MGSITTKDIVDYFQKHCQTHAPSSSDRVLILSRYIFNLAIKWEMNGSSRNPAQPVDLLNKNNKVQRPLKEEEYPKLVEAINESSNEHLKYIVLLLLLTGARRGEVLKARWENIDMVAGHWKIPMTKSGHPHTIYLTDRMVKILNAVGTKGKSEYVFPSHTPESVKPAPTLSLSPPASTF